MGVQSHECHMTILFMSHAHHMSVTCSSHVCHMLVTCSSHAVCYMERGPGEVDDHLDNRWVASDDVIQLEHLRSKKEEEEEEEEKEEEEEEESKMS